MTCLQWQQAFRVCLFMGKALEVQGNRMPAAHTIRCTARLLPKVL